MDKLAGEWVILRYGASCKSRYNFYTRLCSDETVLLLPGGQNNRNRGKSPHSTIEGIGDFYKVLRQQEKRMSCAKIKQ